MPRNGSGTYTLPEAAFTPGTTISSADVNNNFDDIATALTGSVAADGQTAMTGALRLPNGTQALPALTFTNEVTTGLFYPAAGKVSISLDNTQVITFDKAKRGASTTGAMIYYGDGTVPTVPVGCILDFAGTDVPSGWVLPYGQLILRASYPEAFHVLGTVFGAGDGSTTFALPDLRGRIVAGKDNMGGSAASRITTAGSGIDGAGVGSVGGAQNVTLVRADLPNTSITMSGTQSLSATVGGSEARAASGSSTTTPVNPAGAVAIYAADQFNTVAISQVNFANASFNLNGNTTQTNVNKMPPTIILNKIIYLGRV